jgi:two-component system, response regulator YesN
LVRVLLADDEEIIREGIHGCIDWESIGCVVVGAAEDGEQALQMVEELKPNLIITDIRMPFINGLEFIEKIKSQSPDIFVIIVSGHDEFQYAQQAVKLGVSEYILKPIEPEYLREIILKIKKQFQERMGVKDEIKNLKENFQSHLPLVKERMIKDIVLGKLDSPDLIESYVFGLGEFVNNCYITIIAQLDDYYFIVKEMDEAGRKRLDKVFSNSIKKLEKLGMDLVVLENTNHEVTLCMSGSSHEDLKYKVEKLCMEVRASIVQNSECTVTMALGDFYDSIPGLAYSCNDAGEALLYKFIMGNNQDISLRLVKALGKRESLDFGSIDSGLVSAIKMADKKLIKEKLDALVNNINQAGQDSYSYVKLIIGSTYMQALKAIKEVGGTAEEVLADPVKAYGSIISHQTVSGMLKELLQFLYQVIDYIVLKRNGKFDSIIEKAKQLISQKYSDTNFSLDDVANHVNISACYFSVIFKQEVGETFIDYITRTRIERAKELLKISHYKAYEISFMVGYNNPTYFSTTFKKLTGCSPTEFRLLN